MAALLQKFDLSLQENNEKTCNYQSNLPNSIQQLDALL